MSVSRRERTRLRLAAAFSEGLTVSQPVNSTEMGREPPAAGRAQPVSRSAGQRLPDELRQLILVAVVQLPEALARPGGGQQHGRKQRVGS